MNQSWFKQTNHLQCFQQVCIYLAKVLWTLGTPDLWGPHWSHCEEFDAVQFRWVCCCFTWGWNLSCLMFGLWHIVRIDKVHQHMSEAIFLIKHSATNSFSHAKCSSAVAEST